MFNWSIKLQRVQRLPHMTEHRSVSDNLLAADELWSDSLDLSPEVGGTDGFDVRRRPQTLGQLSEF